MKSLSRRVLSADISLLADHSWYFLMNAPPVISKTSTKSPNELDIDIYDKGVHEERRLVIGREPVANRDLPRT